MGAPKDGAPKKRKSVIGDKLTLKDGRIVIYVKRLKGIFFVGINESNMLASYTDSMVREWYEPEAKRPH